MERLADHGSGVALIFAKTETKLWFDSVWSKATALLFIRNRLHFYTAEGHMAPHNSGAPSVLVAYGNADAEILACEPIEGHFVALRLPISYLIASPRDKTWREIIESIAPEERVLDLSDLYRYLADHPKAEKNPNWRAKVRQTLQRAKYKNVGPGRWEKAA